MTALEQAARFVAAALAHAAAGCPVVTPEQLAGRLAICGTCEHFDRHRVKCLYCGCWLDRKAAWAEQSCPIGLWGPISETSP